MRKTLESHDVNECTGGHYGSPGWQAIHCSLGPRSPPIPPVAFAMLARYAKEAVSSLGLRCGATLLPPLADSSATLRSLVVRGYATGERERMISCREAMQAAQGGPKWLRVWEDCVPAAVVDGLKYAKSHEYVKNEGGVATVGISDFAQVRREGG